MPFPIMPILKKGGFSAEAQAVIDLMTGLTNDEKNFIATYVDAEVSNGNWSSNYDEFWCYGLISEANSLIGWKGLKTATNGGATKTANGFSFNGSSDYIDTNFKPSVDGVNFTQNDALAMSYTYDGLGKTAFVFDSFDGTNSKRTGMRETGFSINGVIVADAISLADEEQIGVVRDGADYYLMRDGAVSLSRNTTSDGLTASNIILGARGDKTTAFYDGDLSYFVVGSEIGFDHSDHFTNLNTLLTSLGVI